MIVTDLHLRNFRNYESEHLTLSSGLNLITGWNAQGKTNLLESLVYLSLTRSHRVSSEIQLIRDGCAFADIGCTVVDAEEKKLRAVIHHGGHTLSVNQVPVKRSSEFVGLLNAVLFSPDDLGVFSDAPRERRRIMDQEISKLNASYVYQMNRYRNLLKERNTLLKSYQPDLAYLDVLDEQMIQEEIPIIRARRAFADAINDTIQSHYQDLFMDQAEACVVYQTSFAEEDLEKELRTLYQENRSRDLDNHVTGIGVHRDDLVYMLNGKNVVLAASQGQKRLMMLAFKCSILDYIWKETGKSAVFLLDDVLSELDMKRQVRLIERIQKPYQCVITATEVPAFLRDGTHKEFRIEHGHVLDGRNT